jgi:hypothetical protein
VNLAWGHYLATGYKTSAPDIAAAANAHAGRRDEARAIVADWRRPFFDRHGAFMAANQRLRRAIMNENGVAARAGLSEPRDGRSW